MRGFLILCSWLWLVSEAAVFAQCSVPGFEYPCCCETCSCANCADIEICKDLETQLGESPGTFCTAASPGDCSVAGTPCSTWWENNTEGVVTDESVTTYGPGGCIPIDGGLGFLIAGGLGIGVIGIRRRKGELDLERD